MDLLQLVDKIEEIDPDLKKYLASFRNSITFAAPEMESFWFRELIDLLTSHALDHPKQDEIKIVILEYLKEKVK